MVRRFEFFCFFFSLFFFVFGGRNSDKDSNLFFCQGFFRVFGAILLIAGGTCCLAAFGMFLGTFTFYFGPALNLNPYGRAMMAFTFITFPASLVCAIFLCIARSDY